MDWKPTAIVIAGLTILAVVGFVLLGDRVEDIPPDIAFGNGRIEAVQVDISTKIAGRVEEVIAQEGDLVEPGRTLARIDTAQLRARLLQAQAEIARAESEVAAAKASIAQAKAQLVLAELELDRAGKLLRKGHTSQEVFDTRTSRRDVAKANLTAAKAVLTSRQRAVDAAVAVSDEIKTQISDATLVSPTIGRVLYRLAEPGEVLGSGGKVLTLINLAEIYMEIFLPSAQAHQVSIGNEARIKLDILDFAIPAKVSFVSPQSQFTPKHVETESERAKLMFRVKVRVPQELVRKHIHRVKTGVRGIAYVRLDTNEQSEWPEFLQNLPPSVERTMATD